MIRKKAIVMLLFQFCLLFCPKIKAQVKFEKAAKHVGSIKTISKYTTDADCLATAIYWEAGHESRQGKIAVAEVILNRYHNHFASTICRVITQSGQFGFVNRTPQTKIQSSLFDKCHLIAVDVLKIEQEDYILPKNVLYFNSKGAGKFLQHLRLYTTIGNQNFYIVTGLKG